MTSSSKDTIANLDIVTLEISELTFLGQKWNGGGIIIYVREGITTRILTEYNLPEDIEGIFPEINFRKSEWLLCGIYHPSSQND